MTYIKSFIVPFIVGIAVAWLVGEIVLRQLKRKNRRLRLALDVQRAEEEARRRSAFQNDFDRRDAATRQRIASEGRLRADVETLCGGDAAIVVTDADWFLKRRDPRPLPNGSRLLLSYWSQIECVDEVEHTLYLHSRGEEHDVWQSTDLDASTDLLLGKLVTYQGAEWSPPIAVAVIDMLVRARWPYEVAGAIVEEGLIRAAVWNSGLHLFREEIEANTRKAREEIEARPSPVVEVARELGLNPQPHGTGAGNWKARCPETNHPLFISTVSDQWGCGWCKRKDGAEELRQFVVERRAQRPSAH